MRTFIAIHVSPTNEIKNLLGDFSENLKGIDVKYTELSNYHITLAFLGETPDDQIEQICQDLHAINLTGSKVDVSLHGLGIFENNQKPHVIWIGVEPNNTLHELWIKVKLVISEYDFTIEQQTFSPHLTLGRVRKIRSNHNLDVFQSNYKETSFGQIPISEFVFYQSLLTSKGPIYNPIQKFKI